MRGLQLTPCPTLYQVRFDLSCSICTRQLSEFWVIRTANKSELLALQKRFRKAAAHGKHAEYRISKESFDQACRECNLKPAGTDLADIATCVYGLKQEHRVTLVCFSFRQGPLRTFLRAV